MGITKKFLVLLLEVQKIKKNAQNNSGLMVSVSILVSHGLLVTELDQETPNVSWCLLVVREGSPGDQDTTRKIPLPPRDQETPRDIFLSPCLMWSPQENMRLQETTIPLPFWAFFLIFCISKSKTRNFFVILMKFSCV